MSKDDVVEIRGGAGVVVVSSRGAEPITWRDPDGRERLWAGSEEWPIHAPMLFPVICRVPHDVVRVAGVDHPMQDHGFGRHMTHELVERSTSSVTYVIVADDDTRAQFPYDFRLRTTIAVEDAAVDVHFEVTNQGETSMPYALGWHPAFPWPLQPGADRSGHTVELDQPENAPTRRLDANLLSSVLHPPVAAGGVIVLDDALFADSAVMMPDVSSRSLVYRAPSGDGLRVSWQGFRGLTLWSPVTADLVCLETWSGLPATPEQRDFDQRDDLAKVEAGRTDVYGYRMEVVAAP